MQKLIIFFVFLFSTASFSQETMVNAKLTGETDKKDWIVLGLGSKSVRFQENLESEVSVTSELPSRVSILRVRNSGKIVDYKGFWVYDDDYHISGSVEDFSTLKISPNHPYNEISAEYANSDEKRQKEIISQNLDKTVGVYLLSLSVPYYSDNELQQLLEQIPESLHATEYYKKMKTDFRTKDIEKPKVGERAVEFDLESREGIMISLSDFEGKYRLLDFSSSGCRPCFMAIPEIKEAHEKYGSEIEIISIWNDKTKDVWLNFSKKYKELITWTGLWDSDGYVNGLYQIEILPSYILINPDGEIEKIWNSYRKGKILREMESLFGKK